MPARKPPPPDEKPQRDRFIETAREIEASEDWEEFDRVFDRIVRRRSDDTQPHKPTTSKTKLGGQLQ